MQHSAHSPVKLSTVIRYLGLPPSTKDVFLVLCYNKKEADTITAPPGETERSEQRDARGRTAEGGGPGAAVGVPAPLRLLPKSGHLGGTRLQAAKPQLPQQSMWRPRPRALPRSIASPPPTSPPPASPPPTCRRRPCLTGLLLRVTAEDVRSETRFHRATGRGLRGVRGHARDGLVLRNGHKFKLPPAAP